MQFSKSKGKPTALPHIAGLPLNLPEEAPNPAQTEDLTRPNEDLQAPRHRGERLSRPPTFPGQPPILTLPGFRIWQITLLANSRRGWGRQATFKLIRHPNPADSGIPGKPWYAAALSSPSDLPRDLCPPP